MTGISWETIRDWSSEYTQLAGPFDMGSSAGHLLRRVEFTGEWGEDSVRQYGKYCVSPLAVAPGVVNASELASAARSCDLVGYIREGGKPTERMWVEVLSDYGTYVQVWQGCGNNRGNLVAEAGRRAHAFLADSAAVLNRPVNPIGTSGWEALRGDTLAPLTREPAEDDPQSLQVMRRMYAASGPVLPRGDPNPLYRTGETA